MGSGQAQREAAIAALEQRRAALGDEVVETAIRALRQQLDAPDDAAAGPVQDLRQVTILFLDVVGSTTLARRLDPEEVHAVMDGALARCTAIVEAHQGRVLQYAGDSVLAVFGAGRSREDDAERAVRCGLALRALGRVLGAEVRARHGHDGFDLRIGVHTGEVLLGGGVDAEGSIRGIAVNVAARMEQTAPPGGLRISQDCHAQVRGLFEAEPQPPIAVKGLDEPVLSWLVHDARPRAWRVATRGIEGVATRMVGREAELRQLQQAWAALFAEPRLELITVLGEAGTGKSRLLREFEAWCDGRPERVRVFRGRAYPATQSRPYGLLRDMIAARLQISDDDSVDVARRRVEAGIVPLFEADDGPVIAQAHAHVLGQLIGIDFTDSPHVRSMADDARRARTHAFHVAAQMLRRIARGGAGGAATPIVLLLEDLHWADDGTLDFLDYLWLAARDVPLLALVLARPVLLERRPAWGQGSDGARRLVLGPLDAQASRQLADELLQRLPPGAAEDLHALIVGRAEGNPFYMEELVRMLIDQGAIVTSDSGWTLRPGKMQAAQLPTTLTGVLQARLDGLPRTERSALQTASVIGAVFWDRALGALDAHAPSALPALARRELVLPHDDTVLADAREFAFHHQILHRVTYGTLLRRTRRALHARAAAWLAAAHGERASEVLGVIAEHYEQAGDDGTACRYYAGAAEYAKARHAQDVALRQCDRGLALLAAGAVADAPALRWRLLVVREFALHTLGRRDEQRAALGALWEAADALGDDRLRALALRRQSQFALRIADPAAQAAAARQAIAIATRCGDAESRLEAQRLLADAMAAAGELDAAEALAREGLAEALARGLRRTEALFLNALSFVALQRDDMVSGLELDLQDLAIWRELGDRHGEAVALGNVGADWLWFGDIERAIPPLEQALRLMRAFGARAMQLAPLGNLSSAKRWSGDAESALALAQEAAAIAVEVQARDVEVDARIRVGDAELELGRHEAAEQTYAQAELRAQAIGHAGMHRARAGRALAVLAGGNTDRALQLVAPLIERANGTDAIDERQVLLICHQVLARAGDARAGALLEAAHASLQRRLATIADAALRDSFVQRVPENHAIAQAWAQWRGGAAG